jgi:O-antigen/teichoic acid export membrane protein
MPAAARTPEAMSLGESIRSGVKWLAFGKIGGRLFEFAFGVALARLLVPADFGMIATIAIFTGFVGMFVAGGMGQSLIRAKHADLNDFTAVFTLQLATGIVVYLVFFVCAPLIAHFFDEPLYVDLIRVSALSFLLRPLVAMRNAWLNREMQFKSRTYVDLSMGFFGGALSVTLALTGLGVWSLVLSGLITALVSNFWLARLTPFKPQLNLDVATMRKHAGFGAKIVGTDFIDYLRNQGKILILSKLAGPTFVGLFNKAESLSRLPNQFLMSPTMEPLFRAMSKSQDNLDQVKYLFYRAITLLTAYTAPAYVLLWWTAEPFITFVYGTKWSDAGGPMSILTLVGFVLNFALPSSVLLAVRNRLTGEMVATAINIPIMAAACIVGLQWGLEGAAWGFVLAQWIHAIQLYALVLKALPTRVTDLLRAVAPGLTLAGMTFVFLALVDATLGDRQTSQPWLYLLVMWALGGAFAVAAFLTTPLAALKSEAARWRGIVGTRLASTRRRGEP